MTFFLIGGYSTGNPGDEAILKATVYFLNERFPGSYFHVWTDKNEFEPVFESGVRLAIVRWRGLDGWFDPGFLRKVFVKLYTDLFPLGKWIARWTARPSPEFLRKLAEADRVIFTGGGYINSYYNLIQMNYLAGIARRLGKPLTLLGQSLGPFRKPAHRRMAAEIFRAAENIVLRENISASEVTEFRAKVVCGIDDAVGFRPRLSTELQRRVESYFTPARDGHFHIGLTLRRWEDSRNFYPDLARALLHFAEDNPDLPMKVLFVPMEDSRYCDDREEGERFGRHLNGLFPYEVVRDVLPVEAKHRLISSLDLYVGMRLHGLIFSLAGGVPSLGIYNNEYYSRKIRGVFRAFGAEKHTLSHEQIDELPSRMNDLLRDRDACRADLLGRRDVLVSNQRSLLESVLGGSR